MDFLGMLKWFIMVLALVAIVAVVIRLVIRQINKRVPPGGINESLFVDINGTKQWISIYGKDVRNPVLLYLHGGPGVSTSSYDYAFTRKWADVYTVVTWDQRNCGKSYSESQNSTMLTKDLMISDGLEMTKFIRSYLGRDKITILGHSWGTYLGCSLISVYPEYYDCYIGTGQLVDFEKNEAAFKEEARNWVGNEDAGIRLLEQLTVGDYSKSYYEARNAIMKKYGYHIFAAGTDYNVTAAILFNPYYSLRDYYQYIKTDFAVYDAFTASDEFCKLSLLEKVDYQVPVYMINGDKDYQTNYIIAGEYFDKIHAPRKKHYIMKDTTHGLLESKSKEFSAILHMIAQEEQSAR